jgi:beta-glucosidase
MCTTGRHAVLLDFPGENGTVRYSEGIHIGCRYYDARDTAVDFPFGYGLSVEVPTRELRAFTKIRLAPGERRLLTLDVLREDLRHFRHRADAWVHKGGPALVEAGSSSRDVRLVPRSIYPADPPTCR